MVWQPPSVGATARRSRTFTAEDVEGFARLSGDRNPLHFDADFAGRTRVGALVVQGGLTTGLFNALVAMDLPGPGSVFLHQEWDYPAPVFIGDTVTAEVTVIEARAEQHRRAHRTTRGLSSLRTQGWAPRPHQGSVPPAPGQNRWPVLQQIRITVIHGRHWPANRRLQQGAPTSSN